MFETIERVFGTLWPAATACAVLAAAAFAAGSPGTPGSAPRNDSWRVVGPGGGGTLIAPAVSPLDCNVVLEHCDMTGAYVTTDGGRSWRMFNLGTGLSCYAYDPGDANVIYAGNSALWRSTDKGVTWSMILPDPERNTAVHMRGDHSSFDLTSDDPAYPRGATATIDAIVVDPRDSKRIFIIMDGKAMLSGDAGRSWLSGRRLDGRILFADMDGKSGTITVVTPAAVYVCEDNEWKTQSSPAGVTLEYASCGRDAKGEFVIYATGPAKWSGKNLSGGIFATRDRGKTWTELAAPVGAKAAKPGEGDAPRFTAIGCSGLHADTVYAGFGGLAMEDAPAWGMMGVARSADGGKSWEIVKAEGLHPSTNADISWVESRMEENIARRGEPDPNVTFWPPRDIGVAPGNPDICYVTDIFRSYQTLDSGRTWRTINSVKLDDDRWTTAGLDVTTCYGVHFDPKAKARLYITYTDIGLFRSEDNGVSWIPSTTGIPLNWRNTTYWLAFDPEVTDLVWGAFSYVHDLPRPKMWRNRDVAGYQGGVAVSADGGATWKVSSEGMAETAVTHIIMDPKSPVGRRTLYACGFGTGVWKSTDNGRTWRLRNVGIGFAEPFAWRLTLADDGTLYAIVARRNEMAGARPEEEGALYKSTDGAETWRRMPLPEGANGPNGLTIDPRDNKRVYLAAWGVEHKDSHDTGGGIFLSEDGGQTWVCLEDQDQHIYDITIDPKDPDTLYACGFDSAAYRSADRGKTWERLKGYNFKWGHRVICDQNSPGMVYITTFGGSVWHGPAGGDPTAAEDWVTPVAKEP